MKPNRVLFIDPVAPRPYRISDLYGSVPGGTEATVLRVASELSARFRIVLAQSALSHPSEESRGMLDVPYDVKEPCLHAAPDVIVVVRCHKILKRLRRQYPKASLYLWLHCIPGKKCRNLGEIAFRTRTTLVAVSRFHANRLREWVRVHTPDVAPHVRIHWIPNPLDPEMIPEGRRLDPNKLLYLSSPHKGLDQVLEHFHRLRRYYPALRLFVADPGYLRWRVPGSRSHVIQLGTLPHQEVRRHLEEAFCLFYPQWTFEETFGLVYAEANAMGTPVLAHPVGAAPEVLGEVPEQLVDTTRFDNVKRTFEQWRTHGRPRVRAKPAYGLKAVAGQWADLVSAELRASVTGKTSIVRLRESHGTEMSPR